MRIILCILVQRTNTFKYIIIQEIKHRPGVHKFRGQVAQANTFFLERRHVFVGPQYGTSFMSPLWRLQFCGGS